MIYSNLSGGPDSDIKGIIFVSGFHPIGDTVDTPWGKLEVISHDVVADDVVADDEQDDELTADQYHQIQAAESAAENAWLIAAEAPYDDGFEQWEISRGCALDPQSGY